MSRRRFHKSDDEAEINITPMLDMVFILLIFFIVTSSFANVAGVNVSRPSKSKQQVVQESKIVLIEIKNNGTILVNGRELPLIAIRAEVAKNLATNPDAQIVVAAGPNSEAGILVTAIDQARQAGAKKVSIATTQG